MSHIHKALMEDKIKLKLPDVAAHGPASTIPPQNPPPRESLLQRFQQSAASDSPTEILSARVVLVDVDN
ncbi:hypothetical protein M0R45_036835 [Rubus argutus]|uniref:Uncharacterized protein n=1 Tax=Rubus argutus TaxID=59490 RepID=A0AAW1VZW9_RUBAR